MFFFFEILKFRVWWQLLKREFLFYTHWENRKSRFRQKRLIVERNRPKLDPGHVCGTRKGSFDHEHVVILRSCNALFSKRIIKMAYRRAKCIKIWASSICAVCISVLLVSFGTFFSKLFRNSKMACRRAKQMNIWTSWAYVASIWVLLLLNMSKSLFWNLGCNSVMARRRVKRTKIWPLGCYW